MSKKPAKGWSFIEWEDNLGHRWKDNVPSSIVQNMIGNRGMKLIKVIKGDDD